MAVNVLRYNINYSKFVQQRIPVPLRLPILVALVTVLCAPFVFLFNSFITFRNLCLYKLSITPQVVYLQKMLNDKYDSTQRRITISDAQSYNALVLFLKSEAKKTSFFTKGESNVLTPLLYEKSETGQFVYDFIVTVPVSVNFNMDELISLVNTYKLATKTYKVQVR